MSEEWKTALEFVKLFLQLIGIAAPILWAAKFYAFQQAAKQDDAYLGWINALIEEVQTLLRPCAQEIKDNMPADFSACPTKRFSYEFLEAAKKGIVEHPRCAELFPALTRIHRDCAHTNDMLERYEKVYTDEKVSTETRKKRRCSVLSSVKGVADSCENLVKILIQEKSCMAHHRAKLLWFILNLWWADHDRFECACCPKHISP